MLYCDNYNVKVSKWWYVYKKAVTVQELLRLQRTSWRGDYSTDTKPWEIRSARNAAGLSVLTR